MNQKEIADVLLFSAPDAVIVIDEEGKIIKWNPKAEFIFGWTEQEVTGKLLSETIIPHRYREAHTKGLKNFIKTGEGPVLNNTIEIQAIKKDHTEFDVALSISSSIVKDKYIFIGFIRDITEKKKADEQIKQTTSFLDTILENIPNMIFVKDAKELRFVRFNKAGEELLGYSRNDLIGKNDYDFFPKDEADFFTGKDRDVLLKGDLLDIPEEPIHTGKGQRWLHTKKIPIKSRDGVAEYLLGISEDITEEKKAGELLIESNERFLKLFYSNPTALSINTIVGDNGRGGLFVDVNESFEKLTGFTKSELLGKTSAELGLSEANNRINVINTMREVKSLRSIEQTIIHKDGRKISVLLSIEKMKVQNEDCYLSAIIDITDRKATEEKIHILNQSLEKSVLQLEAANKELEAFSYSVSHDLRAPLRIIDGYSDMIVADYNDKLDEEGRRMLGVIRSNAYRMGQLIDNLLNLAKLSRQHLTLYKVDMDELVSTVIKEQIAMQPPSHIIHIEKNKIESANCDSNLMRQVWENLISNAIKYSKFKDPAVIEITSQRDQNEIIYSVRDNGVGFDMQYADKLFGVFQRLHKMTEFEGTGVGLAIVHRIITKHGGRVWSNAEVDKGATFYFSLPV